MQQCQGPVFAWPTFDTVLCSLRASHADHPQEDITCVLYDIFDYIEAAVYQDAPDAAAAQEQSDGVLANLQQQQQQLATHSWQPQCSNQLMPMHDSTSQLEKQHVPLQQDQQLAEQVLSTSQHEVSSSSAAAGSSSRPFAGNGGRVLVHCSQGVSRSTTIAIAYLMWKTNQTYDDMYKVVRAKRGVTSPNVGFMCQLINWGVRTLKRAEFCFL
jgi:protein tyrosine phosphatase